MTGALVRSAVQAFGRLAPELAAAWLERRLMTPRRIAQLALAPPATPGVTLRIPFEDTPLMRTEWGEGPPVLLVHGWGSSTRSFWRIVDPLVARGVRVVALDLPAHGASSGRRTTMLHCAEAVLRTGRELGGRLQGVIGHSFGAPTAVLAARKGLHVGRFVMACPPLSAHNALRQVSRDIGLPEPVFERMARGLAERLQFDWADLDTDFLVSRFEAPLLVVHDEEDRVTPWTHGAAVARAAPRGRLLTTAGLGHRAVLADPHVVERMVDFITGFPEAPTGFTERSAGGAAGVRTDAVKRPTSEAAQRV